MKRTFKIAFFVSLVVISLLVALLVASVVSAESNDSSSISIIGGADGPTAVFVTSSLVIGNPFFYALCFVGVLCIASAIGWIVTKKN